ncbi:hypothetical protein HX13_10380 [Chryseobacterium sp. P1-3]|uniref:DUF4174 domain-containing protein n=1 Tax=Chryseobacterium gallinarum TaxID=1324352 RepID=A0ABX6KPA0_CHRGL|nr:MULTISPECIES: hypothetical protein [Chryseobacterium]KFF74526.1 hypothetical protein HX13_10380 [Chryseobacterium sp. P1-3]QIY89906.1 hypothetical protein FOB44_04200 [Chryseobacterium gallinarum]
MKTLLFPLVLFSVSLSGQEKEQLKVFPKTDTAKIYSENQLLKKFESNPNKRQKKFYKILVSQPKKDITYMALKEPQKDYSKYKILNSIIPEIPKVDLKKIIPSK